MCVVASKAIGSIFATCVVNHLYPNVGMSVSNVVNKLGISTTVEVTQVCCGQPFFNSVYWSDARKLGKKFLELYNSVEDDIVIPSGSCTSMIRNHYPDLFEEEDDLLTIIDDVNSRIYEFTEYVSCILKNDDRKLDVEKNLSIYVDTPKMEGATFRANMQEAAYHTVWIGVGGPTGDVMYDRMHTSFYGAPGRAYSFFEYDGVPATATPGAKIDKLMAVSYTHLTLPTKA